MMSLSRKGISNNDPKLNSPSKKTTLNPNAAEFIPCALRTSSGTTSISGVTSGLVGSGTSGKAALDRSESNVSNNSDDEAHRYWRHQLPDDITPDFKFMGADDLQGPRSLSLAGLSLDDAGDASRFSASMGNGRILSKQQELSSHGIDGDVMIEKMRFSVPSYRENRSSAAFMNLPTDIWHKQFMNGDQHVSSEGEGFPYNGNSGPGFVNDMLGEQLVLDDTNINPVEYLASQFPGFAAESLAEVYCANGYDLNLTIEMLTQLEFQVDNDLNQNLSSKTLLSQNLSVLDFPVLSATDGQNGPLKYSGGDIQQTSNPLQSSGVWSMEV
uniref:Polyadenylate-binding protein-interacting protein 7-like n=1 Tax=Nelumbo nucifera TaxID=4432 RepID=A0A822ZH55_NELNU|nr:TPA_asm: hypothetical protein HUJ06_002457 [Nelumbo nucifera]